MINNGQKKKNCTHKHKIIFYFLNFSLGHGENGRAEIYRRRIVPVSGYEFYPLWGAVVLYSSNRHEGKESSRWCTHTHIHAESRLVVHSLLYSETDTHPKFDGRVEKKTKDQKSFSIFLCMCVWMGQWRGKLRLFKNKTIVQNRFVIICFVSIFERNVEAEKLRKCRSTLVVISPTDVHLKLCRRK